MAISSDIFEASLQCTTKGWLRAHNEAGGDNLYTTWQKQRYAAYRSEGISRWTGKLQQSEFVVSPVAMNKKTALWKCAVDCNAGCNDKSSQIQIIERIEANDPEKRDQFVPVRFIPNNKLTKIDRLMVAYDAMILSESLKTEVGFGKLIHRDNYSTLKVKTSLLVPEVKKMVGKLSTLLSGKTPPDLVLNRHCPECEYQIRCREKAVEKDDLSLLGGMSEKERKKLNSKGIFTVTQLSYTFRPRRRPKRLRDKKEKYHHSLKALAIREKKIHIVGTPELKIEGTPVYLDVEGLPDRDFYYLIGLRYQQGESIVQHSLWADGPDDEERIWKEFLAVVSTIENPVLIHYGSYETSFFKTMRSRYGGVAPDSLGDKTISSAINLLSVIYGHVYFPVVSNGLKDVAGYLGVQWSDDRASGLQSIVWRETWERFNIDSYKKKLFDYNCDDIDALNNIHNTISTKVRKDADKPIVDNNVVYTDKMKKESLYCFGKNNFFIPDLEFINSAAYWHYQRDRIYVKSNAYTTNKYKNMINTNLKPLKINKVIYLDKCSNCCIKCGSSKIKKHGIKSKLLIDLKFVNFGIKKWIVKFIFHRYFCIECKCNYYLQDRPWSKSKYGPGLQSYIIYQIIELLLPQRVVELSLNELFDLDLGTGTIMAHKRMSAKLYKETFDGILNKLLRGKLLHADETKIKLIGKEGVVWVLTSMEEVLYFYTDTREGDIVKLLLAEFKGVLVSDFYTIYDDIDCPQQKCLIHFIRDLNDDILNNPFNNEIKQIGNDFTRLLKPIIDTIEKYGLKKRHLGKHKKFINQYYQKITDCKYNSEIAEKYVKRIEKYRDKLFTFIYFDNVPWNNNNAEHAIKIFASLRNAIEGSTTESGIRDYLTLLSVCETCKYKNVSFLNFLRSGEKDIDVFAASKRRRRGYATKMQTSEVSENLGGLVLAT
jgi:predicted RecB family nuclease